MTDRLVRGALCVYALAVLLAVAGCSIHAHGDQDTRTRVGALEEDMRGMKKWSRDVEAALQQLDARTRPTPAPTPAPTTEKPR